jgi:hypothetical protein
MSNIWDAMAGDIRWMVPTSYYSGVWHAANDWGETLCGKIYDRRLLGNGEEPNGKICKTCISQIVKKTGRIPAVASVKGAKWQKVMAGADKAKKVKPEPKGSLFADTGAL